jgi:hypothetical protein
MTSLRCTLASDVTQTPYEFRPDETKKSAFWLDAGGMGAVREAAAPAECRIECVADLAATPAASSATPQQFYVGGFQLVSNAKMIEVYVNNDQYLTTCRGIPSGEHRPAEQGSDGALPTTPTTYYKAIFAVPGGPRSVRNVVLKLRSLAPKDQQVAHLVMMKLTARLAPDAADSQRATDGSSTAPAPEAGASLPTSPGSQSSPVPAPSLITSASTTASSSSQPVESGRPPSDVDVQSAMLGLSLMLKGTEERVVRSTADKVCREIRPCFASMQAQLQSLSSAMTTQWNSIHTAMGQQQQLIERQQATLRQLAEQQSELKELLLLQRQRQDVSNVVPTEGTYPGRVEPAQVEWGTDAGVRGYISSAGDAEDASGAVGDEVEAGEPGQHQEAAVDSAATVNATCPTTTDFAESHGLDPDDRPEASLDEVLAQAFPIVPSEDDGSGTATHAPSPQGAAPTVMRALDLMDGGDDDPFGECAIVASTTSTLP